MSGLKKEKKKKKGKLCSTSLTVQYLCKLFGILLHRFVSSLPFVCQYGLIALSKAQNDVMEMKMQSERLSKEYDQLLKEHSELQDRLERGNKKRL